MVFTFGPTFDAQTPKGRYERISGVLQFSYNVPNMYAPKFTIFHVRMHFKVDKIECPCKL